jgi:LuxR family maltose regulon positive regulatory protein
MKGDRDAARQAYREAIATSQASGNTIIEISATTGLGQVQESENELHLAADTYRRILRLVGDPPQPMASEAYLGLARICYEWNDLEAAQSHGERAIQLMQLIEETDRLVPYQVFLARLKLAQGDLDGAADIVAEAEQLVRQHNYVHRMPEVAVTQVRVLLRQGKVAAAAELAERYDLSISQARVHLAQGDPSAALAVLGPWRQQVEGEGWKDKRLQATVLQAVALHARGEEDEAMRALGEALALAAPGGFIRTFVDEGRPMAELLSQAAARGMMPDTTDELLAAFEAEGRTLESESDFLPSQPLIEPLTSRELEVLQLIAQGLSNREIGERLFIALSTVKGHNRNIYSKLQVERRTEAVARARELGLL